MPVIQKVKEPWQPARLIPVTGLGGADEQERRGSSAFLAVLQSVREFGRAITSMLGAPTGTIETFIEVPFLLGDQKYRPDGLIRVRRGKREWTALVEVKTGRNCLRADQVGAYVDIARAQGFDAVLTISNELAVVPGGCPVAVDRRKLTKVSLLHLSWSRIHTEALIERANHAISDPDQAWILSEFIRYLEYEKSGAIDFDDMGPSWVSVRDSAVRQSLRPLDKETLDVVTRFNQLVSFAGMRLSRQLGVYVQPAISKKDREDHGGHLQRQANELAKTGCLQGSIIVPGAVAPMVIGVDLRAGRAEVSMTTSAPAAARPGTQISWLLRQLRNSAPATRVTARVTRSRSTGPSRSLSELLENSMSLLTDPKSEIVSFTTSINRLTGTKRGQGRGSFVGSVLELVDEFYTDVAQHLRHLEAPKVKRPEAAEERLGGVDELGLPVTGISDPTAVSEMSKPADVHAILGSMPIALPRQASESIG